MSRFQRFVVFAGLLVVVAACEGTSEGTSTATVRDSAGIEIIESHAPQWGVGEVWTIDPTPLLDLALSGSGPQHEFVHVRDVRRLGDGRILVVDEQLDEVRAYSSDGHFLSSVGRNGEGPGEFQRPMSVEPCWADSLVVWDFWLRRLTVLDSDLNVGRVAIIRDADLRPRQDLFWFGDSTFVGTVYSLADFEDRPGYYRMPIRIARFSFDAEHHDTVATLAGFEGYLHEQVDARPPFGRGSHVAVRSGLIIGGDADRMEFTVYAPDGTVRQIHRVPSYDLSITGAELERELETLAPPEASVFLRELVREMPVPETKPAYAAMRIDSEGFLWAEHYQSYGDLDEAQAWEVFSPSGIWMGTVTTPARFDVLTIGSDHIAGVYEDDLDVQHPQILGLNR